MTDPLPKLRPFIGDVLKRADASLAQEDQQKRAQSTQQTITADRLAQVKNHRNTVRAGLINLLDICKDFHGRAAFGVVDMARFDLASEAILSEVTASETTDSETLAKIAPRTQEQDMGPAVLDAMEKALADRTDND